MTRGLLKVALSFVTTRSKRMMMSVRSLTTVFLLLSIVLTASASCAAITAKQSPC